MFKVGWKTIDVISTRDVPLLNVYKHVPLSALNTLIFVPLTDAVAIRVPSGFTVIQATSDSWASISV